MARMKCDAAHRADERPGERDHEREQRGRLDGPEHNDGGEREHRENEKDPGGEGASAFFFEFFLFGRAEAGGRPQASR